MKRLSQTWKQRKNLNTKSSNASITSKELVFGDKNSRNDAVKREFKSPAITYSRQSKTLQQQDNEVASVSKTSTYITSPNGSLSVSFGFEFDAAALSEMDKLEQEHVPSVTTTPVPHKRRATEKTSSSAAQVSMVELLQKSSNCEKTSPFGVQTGNFSCTVNTTPFGADMRTLKPRERISTPIEETGHSLASPTADLPAFSPVNLTTSAVFDNGDGSRVSEKIEKNAKSNEMVASITAGNGRDKLNEQGGENPRPSLTTSDESSSTTDSTSSKVSVLEIEPSSEGDVLSLSSWGLLPSVLQRYHDMGITHMFEWQAECLRTGNVLRGGNLVYSAPTSAGKTMVAELLMLKRVLETKRKALFILPYVSVAREKMFYLQHLFQEASVRVEGFMGSHNPAGGFAAVDIAVCTIEKANSLLNRLLEENKVSTLGVVVVDEMHMLGDPHRGYLLELFLTKILFVSGQGKVEHGQKNNEKVPETAIQIVCMSATLPNLDMLARWLSGDLYYTDHRPVPLTEMVKVGPTIYDNAMNKIRDIDPTTVVTHDDDHVIPLCKETISGGHSVLIFCPTKNWCEKQAEAIARHFASVGHVGLSKNDKKSVKSGFTKASDLIAFDVEAIKEVLEQLKRTPVGLDSVMKRIIPYSVAYHHAGLTVDERDIIEGAFRQGTIRVLVATSTLCSGVNLPARRVIIRTPTFHGKMVDPLVYKQMAGRAGRKGVDDRGESILVCKATEKHKATTLMKSELKAVQSCLLLKEQNGGLKRALLEVIAGGVVTVLRDVERYAACTFFASSSNENDVSGSQSAITETISFLVDNEFIRVQSVKEKRSNGEEEVEESVEKYVPTQLGAATVASALSPDEALVVFAELQKARKCFVLESELHIIYQVTPIYIEAQWPNIDWNQFLSIWERLPSHMRRVADIVGIQEVYLSLACRGRIPTRTPQHRQQLRVHRRFFAALALQDLVHEVPLNVVARRYGATRGMVQSLQGSASTFAGMVTVFCQRLGWRNLDLLLSQFQSRLSFGVERELCDLVRISVLNAARARMLYNAGFQTIASLASAKVEEVETVLRNAVPFVSGRRHLGETDLEVQHRREARVFWVAGKRGLSEREAAELIIIEAKKHLQDDVAQLGIAWKAPASPSTSSTTDSKPESQSSRDAGTSTRTSSTTRKKRRNSGKRRSSGSFRKSRKSPPSRQRQKSPILNTMNPSTAKAVASQRDSCKIGDKPTVPEGTGHLDKGKRTAINSIPECAGHLDKGKRTTIPTTIPEGAGRLGKGKKTGIDIQKDSTLLARENKRSAETEINMCSEKGQPSKNNMQSIKKIQSSFFQSFAQDQGKGSSSTDTAKTSERNHIDESLNAKNAVEDGPLDRVRGEVRTEKNEKDFKSAKNNKDVFTRGQEKSKLDDKLESASPKDSTTEDSKSISKQERLCNKTNKYNFQSTDNQKISKFLSHGSVTSNQNAGNLIEDRKDFPNKVIDARGNLDLLSRGKVMANEVRGNLDDEMTGFLNENEVSVVQEKSIVTEQAEDGVERNRDLSKMKMKQLDPILETKGTGEKRAGKKGAEDIEKRSEAMEMLCSLTSKSKAKFSTPKSSKSTNEQRLTERCDVFPANVIKPSNKRRSPRTESRDDSPKEKIPRRESHTGQDGKIVGPGSTRQQKDSSLSTTQSFSVQDDSCSSAVLFDNSDDMSVPKPDQPQGTTTTTSTTSPELYSEPLEEEIDRPPSDEVFESQALGFSLSDSYLAQCGGFTQIEPRPVTDARCSPTGQEEFGVSSISDNLMVDLCSNAKEIESRPMNSATEQCSSSTEQGKLDSVSSNSDDLMARHCGSVKEIESRPIVVEDTENCNPVPGNLECNDVTDDVMAKHCSVISQEEAGPNTIVQIVSETEDMGQEVFVRRNRNVNENAKLTNRNQEFMECNDDVIGEFDSCPRYHSTGRFNPSEPCRRSETVLVSSISNISSTSRPKNEHQEGGEESLENSGSFSLNLSLSESIGDDGDLLVAKDSKKEEEQNDSNQLFNEDCAVRLRDDDRNENSKQNVVPGKAETKGTMCNPDENCLEMIGVQNEALDEKKQGRECQFTRTKPKKISNEIENSSHKTPKKRIQEKSSQHKNLVVETPESDISSQVTHSNQASDSPPGSPYVDSQVTHSSKSSDSGSPCVDSPASPSCTFTSVSIIDVSANELLFHTFMREWKTRKEFSFAVGCERLLDNVPKIGDRFNKGPPVSQGPSKGLPIEGTDEVVVGIAVCWSGKDAYYVSLKECDDVEDDNKSPDESVVAPDLPVATRIEGIKSVLEYKGKRKGTKFCFDSIAQYKALAQSSGITLSGEIQDPKIASWLLDPSSKEKTLHHLTGEFASEKAALLEGIGAGFSTGGFGLASQSPASGRARSCTEAVLVYWLMKQLRLNLEKDGLDKAFYQIEMPVMKCLARMELNGIGFSDTECDHLKSVLQSKLRTLEEEAYRLANHSFSLTSPDEVAMVLFVELKLPADGKIDENFPAKRKTLGSTRRASSNGGKRGRKLIKHPSTNKEVLERLKPLHPLPGVILEWRRISCALTKVVYPVQREKQLNSRLNMNRIYPTCQTHTSTGRVSFAEPNLQNVPRDFEIDLPAVFAKKPPQEAQSTTRGRQKTTEINASARSFEVSMRTAFIPFKGGILLAADYSQLELRLIAHLSRDERLLKLLNAGGDVFRMIAGSLYGIEPAAVSDVQRQRSKQICYGIIYGIGGKSLGEQLELSEEDASAYIEKFKSRFSGIKKYLKTTVEECRKNGFVATVAHRRRYLPAINSTNAHARSQAERQAVNTTVQGSAADLVKVAMINIDRKLTEIYTSCRRTHRHKNNDKNDSETSRRKSTRISAQTPKRGSSAQSFKGAHVVLQLHDELILEVTERDLNRVAAIVKREMENALKLSVVLPVKLKAGPSWGTMNPLEL